jgi:lipoprotein-anchoring transpeptidase ErfK/SrfK
MKRVLVIGFILSFLLLVVGSYLIYKNETESSRAYSSLQVSARLISDARKTNIHNFAPHHFQATEKLYNEALALWMTENRRLLIFRNYTAILDYETKIDSVLSEASLLAGKLQGRFEEKFEIRKKQLIDMIQTYEQLYNFLPLQDEVRANYTKGNLLFQESNLALEKGFIESANEKSKAALELITEVNKVGKQKLEDYFSSFNDWSRLHKEAVSASRSGHVILVDKVDRKLYVYKNGREVFVFASDLGANWVGDKNLRGDMTTPEGIYRVVTKKKGRHTKFYKALLINYPNESDRARFEKNKADGLIPKTAHIGNLIEIHGDGGIGIDWTEGCVALTNSDMDKLFSVSEVNTPVYIVGSLRPLNEILDSGTIKPSGR